YPDMKGVPYKTWLIAATAIAPGTTATAYVNPRTTRGARRMAIATSSAASGARFGRVRMAAAVASPAPAIAAVLSPSTSHHARMNHIVTGMSLIGSSDSNRTIGLHATRTAATNPVRGPANRAPKRYVRNTMAPPHKGTT